MSVSCSRARISRLKRPRRMVEVRRSRPRTTRSTPRLATQAITPPPALGPPPTPPAAASARHPGCVPGSRADTSTKIAGRGLRAAGGIFTRPTGSLRSHRQNRSKITPRNSPTRSDQARRSPRILVAFPREATRAAKVVDASHPPCRRLCETLSTCRGEQERRLGWSLVPSGTAVGSGHVAASPIVRSRAPGRSPESQCCDYRWGWLPERDADHNEESLNWPAFLTASTPTWPWT